MASPDKPHLDVEVEVKPLPGGQVELSVRVPAEPVRGTRDQVLAQFARRANIPGFRRGKAPRAVVERYVDQQALKEQIIDALLTDAYEQAREKAGIKALDLARIANADLTAEGALTFQATLTVRPEITLGDYKGLQATRHITPVTDSQVEAELERIRSRHSHFTELPAESGIAPGDLAVVDYEMFVDGEKREEASASGYPLEVGADQLFPELNKELLGARPEEARDFEVTYPEQHSDPSLAGKTARFHVTVRQVRRRQLPDLDDEFAWQVSDLETMAALRDRIRQNLETIGRAIAEEDLRSQLLRQVSESTSLDIPQALVDRETDRRIDEITQDLERRGLGLQQHLRQAGLSFEDWRADLEAEARQTARRALILDEIGEREKIEVTDEEIEAEIHRLAEAEHMDPDRFRERLHDSAEMNRLANRVYHRKILRFLVDQAQVTEEIAPPGEEAPEASATGTPDEAAPAI